MKQNEKGSVTMIVVVTIFFIVILLSSFFIYTTSRRRAQIEETEKIAEAYDGDMEDIYQKVYNSMEEEAVSISTSFGRIDVIWLDTSNNVIEEPISPANYLNGMRATYWTGNSSITGITGGSGGITEYMSSSSNVINNQNNVWYDYIAAEGTDDSRVSRWANAVDSNYNYFVWIPRYAYRITYYENADSNVPTGYYDGRGMVNPEGKLVTSVNGERVNSRLEQGIETVEYNGNSYIVHPAFIDDSANGFNNGGWDSDLPGIWVGKYETSGTSDELLIQPSFISLGSIPSSEDTTIGEMYTYAFNYNRENNLDSHLMKNSEWGAVAYLTHSQYGRNGYEIYINNSSNCMTGNGGGSTSANPVTGITNYYDTANGVLSSSTGNIFGIYDLSGGAWEKVAAWNTSGSDISNASSFATGSSTKYATAYTNESENNSGTDIFSVGKTGDATKEVYTGKDENNWNDDHSYFSNVSNPFFARGGNYNIGNGAGIFASYADNDNNMLDSFRIVLGINQ